jgi:predicted Mrr-cat superfamily restriction endonuclease
MNATRSDYWLLSAGKDGELWPAFFSENKIAIGWSALGDLRQYLSREALLEAHARIWPEVRARARGNAVGQLWRFYREIKSGDTIFIRSFAYLIGTAVVEGDYLFLAEGDPLRERFSSSVDYFPHVREVRWVSLGGGMKQPLALTRLDTFKNPSR